jgi:hypothetical protein
MRRFFSPLFVDKHGLRVTSKPIIFAQVSFLALKGTVSVFIFIVDIFIVGPDMSNHAKTTKINLANWILIDQALTS